MIGRMLVPGLTIAALLAACVPTPSLFQSLGEEGAPAGGAGGATLSPAAPGGLAAGAGGQAGAGAGGTGATGGGSGSGSSGTSGTGGTGGPGTGPTPIPSGSILIPLPTAMPTPSFELGARPGGGAA